MCPGVSGTQAVTHASGFHDNGFEVRHFLQWGQIQVISVGKSFYELSVQTLVDAWSADDVERSSGQGKSGCLYAASNDDLRLILETLLCFI